MHNEKLHNFYCLLDVIGMIESRWSKWARHVVHIGATGFLLGKQNGKRPLGRPRCRWQDNLETNIREIGLGGMESIHLNQEGD
jgi:hypothetical protein